MAAIKKWFEKKKLDAKFKSAGKGHSLHEPAASQSRPVATSRQQVQSQRSAPHGGASAQAARAAIERLDTSKQAKSNQLNRSQQAIKQQARMELQLSSATQNRTGDPALHSIPDELDSAPLLAVQGVFFTTPLLGDNIVLPIDQLLEALEHFLLEQYRDEPLLSSVTMIHTLNRISTKRLAGVEMLTRYLDNVIGNSSEAKFRRIRESNKVYQEKVACLKGGPEFMKAVGFLPTTDATDGESYLILSEDTDMQTIQAARELLLTAEAMPIELYRNPVVYAPSEKPLTVAEGQLPAEFFDRSADELAKEQARLLERVEHMTVLKTKEMRDRDEQRRKYRYRYALIRIRFPDNYVLQGTFRSGEKLEAVQDFVREYLTHDLPFSLHDTAVQTALDCNADISVTDAGLAPAAILNFKWDKDVLANGVREYLLNDVKDRAETV